MPNSVESLLAKYIPDSASLAWWFVVIWFYLYQKSCDTPQNLPSKENKPGNNVFKVEHAHDNHCMQGQGKIHKIEWKIQ